MPCPVVFVAPLFALSALVSLPWMLLWLPVVALPLVIARLAVRHPRSVRWAAVDLVAAAARRVGLTGSGVPWPLVLMRSAMLLLAVLAATRPFLSGKPPGPSARGATSPSPADDGSRIAGGGARRIAVVVPGRAAAADGSLAAGESAATDASLPLRLAIEALGRTGGLSGGLAPAMDVVGTVDGLDPVLAAAATRGRAEASRLLVILCDGAVPNAADAARIASAVERGASLLVLVGRATLESADRSRLSEWLASLAGITVADRIECGGCRFGVVPELADGIVEAGPAVDPTDAFVALAGPVVDRCAELLVDPPSSSHAAATVLARTVPAGRPLLVESRVGDGRVCVSALPLSLPAARLADDVELWSDLAAWPVFVPLVDGLLVRLLEGDGASVAEARPRVEAVDNRSDRSPFRGLPLVAPLLSLAILLALLDPLVSLAFAGRMFPERGDRDGTRAGHARLLPARAAIIGCLVAMLMLWGGGLPPAGGRQPPGQRRVALLIDVSPSMATADAVAPAGDGSSRIERLSAAVRSLNSNGPSGSPLQRLCRERPVTIAAVGPAAVPLGDASPSTAAGLIGGLATLPPAKAASRQGDAVAEAIASGEDGLAAVVVASDGAIEDGLSWMRAAQIALGRRVPIVAIPAGNDGAPAAPGERDVSDVAFTAVRVPPVGWVGEEMAIGVRAERLAPGSDPIPLVAADRDGRVLAEGLLRPDTAGESRAPTAAGVRADLRWTPREAGQRTMLVRSGTGSADGVGVAVPCTIVDEPIRVLLVDAVPRFEHRFLEQSLARDPRFEVQTCLLESGTTPGMRSTASIPKSAVEWERFDVVVLGDVVPGNGGFSEAAAKSLRDAAAATGIGLAWSPGRRFRGVAAMAAGAAGDWLPAMPLESSDRPAVVPRRLRITPAGRDDGWFLQAGATSVASASEPDATDDADRKVFAALGPVRLRPTARILAVSEPCGEAVDAARTASGPAAPSLPAIVLDRIGGATLLCHLCETWRWRDDGGTDAYWHYWRRSLMRLAERRFLSRLVAATIDVRPLQPREGDEVRIDVVATRSGTDRDGWMLEHVGPDTPVDAPRRIDVDSPAGTRRIGRLEPGWHTLRLRAPDGSTVVREFSVAARRLERPGTRARLAGMEAAAIASGGVVVPLDRIASLPDAIAQLERHAEAGRAAAEPAAARRLADSSAAARWVANLLMAALITSCGIEWSLRARVGLS